MDRVHDVKELDSKGRKCCAKVLRLTDEDIHNPARLRVGEYVCLCSRG
jgi:hypothetical protein